MQEMTKSEKTASSVHPKKKSRKINHLRDFVQVLQENPKG